MAECGLSIDMVSRGRSSRALDAMLSAGQDMRRQDPQGPCAEGVSWPDARATGNSLLLTPPTPQAPPTFPPAHNRSLVFGDRPFTYRGKADLTAWSECCGWHVEGRPNIESDILTRVLWEMLRCCLT